MKSTSSSIRRIRQSSRRANGDASHNAAASADDDDGRHYQPRGHQRYEPPLPTSVTHVSKQVSGGGAGGNFNGFITCPPPIRPPRRLLVTPSPDACFEVLTCNNEPFPVFAEGGSFAIEGEVDIDGCATIRPKEAVLPISIDEGQLAVDLVDGTLRLVNAIVDGEPVPFELDGPAVVTADDPLPVNVGGTVNVQTNDPLPVDVYGSVYVGSSEPLVADLDGVVQLISGSEPLFLELENDPSEPLLIDAHVVTNVKGGTLALRADDPLLLDAQGDITITEGLLQVEPEDSHFPVQLSGEIVVTEALVDAYVGGKLEVCGTEGLAVCTGDEPLYLATNSGPLNVHLEGEVNVQFSSSEPLALDVQGCVAVCSASDSEPLFVDAVVDGCVAVRGCESEPVTVVGHLRFENGPDGGLPVRLDDDPNADAPCVVRAPTCNTAQTPFICQDRLEGDAEAGDRLHLRVVPPLNAPNSAKCVSRLCFDLSGIASASTQPIYVNIVSGGVTTFSRCIPRNEFESATRCLGLPVGSSSNRFRWDFEPLTGCDVSLVYGDVDVVEVSIVLEENLNGGAISASAVGCHVCATCPMPTPLEEPACRLFGVGGNTENAEGHTFTKFVEIDAQTGATTELADTLVNWGYFNVSLATHPFTRQLYGIGPRTSANGPYDIFIVDPTNPTQAPTVVANIGTAPTYMQGFRVSGCTFRATDAAFFITAHNVNLVDNHGIYQIDLSNGDFLSNVTLIVQGRGNGLASDCNGRLLISLNVGNDDTTSVQYVDPSDGMVGPLIAEMANANVPSALTSYTTCSCTEFYLPLVEQSGNRPAQLYNLNVPLSELSAVGPTLNGLCSLATVPNVINVPTPNAPAQPPRPGPAA